ncbi:MAG: hypothetical protein IJD36_05030 [Clostridia bacterium]|nr:hypothetical protein [Clostridia bacterium]
MKRNNCSGWRKCCPTIGIVLISMGIGIFLAYILPYQLLITLFAFALIGCGIRHILKKW